MLYPAWLCGEVIDHTGNSSYQVLLADGRTFRRHIDHIRVNSASSKTVSPAVQFTWDTSPPATPDVSAPEPEPVTSEPEPEPETLESESESETSEPEPRYPTRTRRPPNTYAPYVTH